MPPPPAPVASEPLDGLPNGHSDSASTSDARVVHSGYVYDPTMMQHKEIWRPDNNPNPEIPERILKIHDMLREGGILPRRMVQIHGRLATRSEVLLVHSEDLWDRVDAIQHMDTDMIMNSITYYDHLSLYVSEATTKCALLSCGGTIEAALAVATGRVRNAFAIVRPPGHHAEPEEHMGFCFFNNVAVATRVVQEETNCKRILILDWDVHHGNGTQRAFWDDPSVLYISLHRYDGGKFYPSGPFGSMEMVGEGPGRGYCVNIPWPEAGMGDAEYLYAFQQLVMPIAYEFAPDMVMISAGFDAADGDPLGGCLVSPAGYAHMTHMLSGLAGGKLCVALEGGYETKVIADSALAVARVLVGDAPPQLGPLVANETSTQAIWQCSLVLSRFWKSIVPKALEPPEEVDEPSFTVSEILKIHRQRHMYTTRGMLEVPLHDEMLHELYSGQLLITADILDNPGTVLVFVHDMGDLRVEFRSLGSYDVNIEHSYLVDTSDRVLKWAKERGWEMLDINVFPKPTTDEKEKKLSERKLGGLLEYVWDNYLQLSDCKNIVLMSYNMGATAIASLLRSRSVSSKVRALVHVLGFDSWPSVAGFSADTLDWFKANSLTLIPRGHPQAQLRKPLARLGEYAFYEESRLADLLKSAMPSIDAFLTSKLAPVAAASAGAAGDAGFDAGRMTNGDVPMAVA
ncbi:hypothetical protein AURDEDRAFT_82103 [Auricularia subglabra TFB-10046 SS5]|nr:hypothetical protein AURDEDRAFT_82103 [Auricularia subglabra TFB-10046 SS5]